MVRLRPAKSAVGTVRGLTVIECVWVPPRREGGVALAACLDPKVSLSLDSPPALVCASTVWVRAQLVHGFNRCVHFPSQRPPVELKVTRALGRVSEPDKQLKLIRSPASPPHESTR